MFQHTLPPVIVPTQKLPRALNTEFQTLVQKQAQAIDQDHTRALEVMDTKTNATTTFPLTPENPLQSKTTGDDSSLSNPNQDNDNNCDVSSGVYSSIVSSPTLPEPVIVHIRDPRSAVTTVPSSNLRRFNRSLKKTIFKLVEKLNHFTPAYFRGWMIVFQSILQNLRG